MAKHHSIKHHLAAAEHHLEAAKHHFLAAVHHGAGDTAAARHEPSLDD